MAKVRDIITGSMRLLGLVAEGETISAAAAADGMSALNSLLDSWAVENLMISAQTRETFDLVPGKGSYKMGPEEVPAPVFPDLPTVDFDTSRPIAIANAAIEYQGSSTFEVPVDIINPDEWANITLKNLSGDPRKLYVESAPKNLLLYVWPVPSTALKLALYTKKPLQAFATLNTELLLPPGLEPTIRYNLALELAPEYGKDPSALVLARAGDLKSNFKRANSPEILLQVDRALVGVGGFNIRTGE